MMLLEKIRKMIKNDASSNSSIAKFIVDNLDEFCFLSLEEVSKRTQTSKASVVRFAKQLGLHGFMELSYALKRDQNNVNMMNNSFYVKNDLTFDDEWYTNYTIIKNETANLILNSYINDYQKINIIIKKILSAKTVFIFAGNIAYNTSRNFAQRIRWINKNVIHEKDISSINSYLDIMTEDDLVIVVSLSGDSDFLKHIMPKMNKISNAHSFGILGDGSPYVNKFNTVFTIPQNESKLWDIYSIRAQGFIQLLDFLYLDLNKNI